MARQNRGKRQQELGPVNSEAMKVKKCGPITPPTGVDGGEAHRYSSWIREGKISSEVFCKNPERRIELGLPAIYTES